MISVLTNSKYMRLLSSSAISQMGSFFTYMLFIVVSYGKTHSIASTMGIMLSAALGTAISGVLSGVLVDRKSPLKLMMIANLMAAVPIASLFWLPSSEISYYCVAFLTAVLTTIISPSQMKYQVQIVDSEKLPAANSLSQMSQEIVKVLGPSIAVFVLALLPEDLKKVGFLIDSSSYLLTSLLILTLLSQQKEASNKKDSSECKSVPESAPESKASWFKSWMESFSTIRTPIVLVVVVLFCFILFGISGTDVTFTAYLAQRGYPTLDLGYVISSLSLGIIITSFVAEFLVRRLPIFITIGMMCTFIGVFYGLIGFDRNLAQILILAFCVGVFNAVFNVSAVTFFQKVVNIDRMGRFFGLITSLFSMVGLLGIMVNGTVGSLYGAETTIILCGSIIVVVSLLSIPAMLLYSRRYVKPGFIQQDAT
jgi:DHA3 family macrolide efflux protein-like MFS transporter